MRFRGKGLGTSTQGSGATTLRRESRSFKIASINVSDRRSWTIEVASVDGGPTRLELGRDTDSLTLNDRLAQIVAAYPMVAARVGGTPQSIDARYPNGLAASPPAKFR